ncbi:hypothetical protein H1P_1080018 [Hyella patelloides LEGE 07179]|uniref:Uncharacterized protein n=1 Tax=Hyella patelloides LEGE 07179 TaxID=945734 RepID=A0A563VJF3_9CYAN|nr:hypothetical protein [Hyella patelloides]VEP11531.1 hypothetical protein H1P_1080018 [Hyella patelloides LEGE 07179]
MKDIIAKFLERDIEPFDDYLYGESFRCSVYLTDGTYLPCVILRKSTKIVVPISWINKTTVGSDR